MATICRLGSDYAGAGVRQSVNNQTWVEGGVRESHRRWHRRHRGASDGRMTPNPEPGNMHRDNRDVWPTDEPVGSFDIEQHGVQGYKATAHIIFVCPRGKRCSILLGPEFVDRPTPDSLCVWKWDGNVERPTITPSINCISEKNGKPTGGCGWHGFITNGVMR